MLSLISCLGNKQSIREAAFARITPMQIEEMNDEMTLSIPKLNNEIQTPRFGELIALEVKNNSKDLIIFPSDYGLQMYTYDENKEMWTEIMNITEYYPVGNRQVSPKGEETLGRILITVRPDLPSTSNNTDLRIIIIGTIYHDGVSTDKRVGAYADITVQP